MEIDDLIEWDEELFGVNREDLITKRKENG